MISPGNLPRKGILGKRIRMRPTMIVIMPMSTRNFPRPERSIMS